VHAKTKAVEKGKKKIKKKITLGRQTDVVQNSCGGREEGGLWLCVYVEKK